MNGPFKKLLSSGKRQTAHCAGKLLMLPARDVLNVRADTGSRTVGPCGDVSARSPLVGGVLDADEALDLLNSHFFLAKVKGAYPVAQIEDDGSVRYLSKQDFTTKLANIFVSVSDGQGAKKKAKAEQFWLSSPHREEREVIFDPYQPAGLATSGRYNLWTGFAVEPRKPTTKHRPMLRHIHQVICSRDKVKFKYLVRWLAWAVQNPHLNPETVIVLKSRRQGTGKSTLSVWMRDIFGKHARCIPDKDRLLARFNADLETAVFIDADELLWAGDHGTSDKLKSVITGDTLTIEVKHGATWTIPNRLHMILTTNHEHAVQAGVQDRRFFVIEVSEHKAQDAEWFGRIYKDRGAGGPAEFLCFLQHIQLGGWHPRDMPRTAESIEQQRFSADSVSQWVQACIEKGAIAGADPFVYPLDKNLCD